MRLGPPTRRPSAPPRASRSPARTRPRPSGPLRARKGESRVSAGSTARSSSGRGRERRERDALLLGFLGAGALPLPFLGSSPGADFRLPVVGPAAVSSSSSLAASSSSDASSSSPEKPSKSDCVRGSRESVSRGSEPGGVGGSNEREGTHGTLVLLHVVDVRLVKVAHELGHAVVELVLELVLVLVLVRLVVALHAELLELLLGLDLALAVQDGLPHVLVDVERLVAVRARLEPRDELALERLLELRRRERLGLARRLALLRLLLDRDELRAGGGCEGAGVRSRSARAERERVGERATHASFILSFFIRMRYCVILVKRCLHLWTRKSGQ